MSHLPTLRCCCGRGGTKWVSSHPIAGSAALANTSIVTQVLPRGRIATPHFAEEAREARSTYQHRKTVIPKRACEDQSTRLLFWAMMHWKRSGLRPYLASAEKGHQPFTATVRSDIQTPCKHGDHRGTSCRRLPRQSASAVQSALDKASHLPCSTFPFRPSSALTSARTQPSGTASS